MREKVIARLNELKEVCGSLHSEFNTFDVDGVEDLSTLTDEELIEVLENFGTFDG